MPTTNTPDPQEIEEMADQIMRVLAERAKKPENWFLLKPEFRIAASGQATSHVACQKLAPLNDNELKSIYALLAYVSYNENVDQETVQAVVEAKFGVRHVTHLEQEAYDDVVKFLVDLELDEMRSH